MGAQSADVDRFMASSAHPRKAEIARVRAIILGADPRITERIKWNAPSFCIAGDDRVTLRLQPRDRLEIIFHRGARVRDSGDFTFADDSGLLRWLAPDRAVMVLADDAALARHEAALRERVARWMAATAG